MKIDSVAPNFITSAVMADGSLVDSLDFYQKIDGKYALLFFYPLDFTFVCPTELITLDARLKELDSLNVEVVAISVDSHFTHKAWRDTPVEKGGIGPVGYTLASDLGHQIAKLYEVESLDGLVALRSAFIINKQKIICAQISTGFSVGRNIDEIIRLVRAIQYNEEYGVGCQANWQQGDGGVKLS